MNTSDSNLAEVARRKPVALWQRAIGFGLAYFVCAMASNLLSVHGATYVSFWLPAGLYVAVLLMNKCHAWPWLVLASLPANLLFDFIHETKIIPAFLFYCADTIQAVAGAWLVRQFVVARPTLATLKEFAGLLGLAALLSTVPGALIGAATLIHFGLSQSFEQSWKVWWGSNVMAVLVFTPFLLAWFSKPGEVRNRVGPPKFFAEASMLLVSVVIYASLLLIWGQGIMSTHRALAIPLLLWAGLRFGLRGATTVTLFFSLTLAFFTARFSIGLTPEQAESGEYVFPMQIILAMASLVALIPAIVISERNRTLANLRESEERFKNLAAAAFEGISISEDGRILDVNDQFVRMFGYDRDELKGMEIINLVAPASRPVVVEAIRENREAIYSHQLLRKDGSLFYAEAQAKMVHVGNRMLRMTAVRDVTERKLAEAALQESELQRNKASQREQEARIKYTLQLIAAQEAERARIAAELHDSLGQNLLLIRNHVQLVPEHEAASAGLREQVKGISQLATQAIAEIRRISQDLHPPQLDHLGLTRALETMIDNTAQASGIVFERKLDRVDDIFSKDAALNVYRIFQESLNNILKHARAHRVQIKLERDVHAVELSIVDDGCGFEMGAAGDSPTGLGLKNIKERVRMLGGKLAINSRPGHGTRVEVTVAIPKGK